MRMEEEMEAGEEGYYSYDAEEKVRGTEGSFEGVKEVGSKDLNVGFFQREGFLNPALVKDKDGIGIRLHGSPITLSDIRAGLGSRRPVESLDTRTLVKSEMSAKDWQKYLESPFESRGGKILSGSLEFSRCKLDARIVSPRVVRQVDWVDKVWPRHLKEMQNESPIEDMMYPRVQKILFLHSKGSYNDFRIDPGGASVWLYAHSGCQTFVLVPPTDDNFKSYEDWVSCKRRSDTFFPDVAKNVGKIELTAGYTLFIPGGWMYASFSHEDTILFGGYFVHSFGIEKQLQVAFMEEILKVSPKERYPFFTEMLWYVLDRYIHRLLGKTHLDLPEEEKRRMKLERGENIDPNKEFFLKNGGNLTPPTEHVHLTQAELQGIKFIVMYLHQLPPNKKNVPIMLPDPIDVIKDVRALVVKHKDDCPEKAVSSKCILRWTENDDVESGLKKYRKTVTETVEKKKPGPKPRADGASKPTYKKVSNGNRRRRVRCKVCEACQGGDCRVCVYCKDMTKYGGPGRMKQTCEKRRCLQPQLPICAFCSLCKLDGWFNVPKMQSKETDRPEEPPNLFECTVCLDIVHPTCAEKTIGLGKINGDLSNSWECANCVNSGFATVPSRNKKRKLSGDDSSAQTPSSEEPPKKEEEAS